MGSVFLARDTELDRPVAIKLLADHLTGDAAFRERFVREARTAARLAHANVVAVFDAGEEDERPFIVMEYVDGENLDAILRRRGPLPVEEAVSLAVQACAGLAHAHAAGLVHRDVKPHNLLVGRDGTLKVADFGIARAIEASRLTEAGTILGTAAYLAPEQAAGEAVTSAADVYSLAAVLYQLLSGCTPYEFDSLAELGRKQRDEPITPLREVAPGVPEAVETVVMRALARLPEYRPASAADLGHELAAAIGAPSERPAESATAPLPRPYRSSRRRAWTGAAAVLAAGALAVALAVADDDEPASVEPQPIAPGATPAEGARNLAQWLRDHAAEE